MRITYMLLILFYNSILFAQDVIIYQNGDEQQAKVLKINKDEVIFKKHENLNGPDYTELKKNIFMIMYEGGAKDVFDINEKLDKTTNKNTSNEPINQNIYAGKEISYSNGVPIISYTEKDMVLAMTLRQGRQYGKYYIAEIMIFNGTSENIDFVPQNLIYPLFINGGIVTNGEVMSYEAYNKKVKTSQAWRAVGIGLLNGLAAYNAGYSTSQTSGSVTGYGTSTTNSYVDVYGSGGWATGYGTSTTNSSINMYGSSTTTTYDAGAAYAANQNAARNTANFQVYQEIKKEKIQYEYLKRHTLRPGEEISGKVNIPYEEADIVEINILINGKEYVFDFTSDLILELND